MDTLHKNKEAVARQAELLAKEREKVEVKGYLERFTSKWGRSKRSKDGKDGSGDLKEVRSGTRWVMCCAVWLADWQRRMMMRTPAWSWACSRRD